MQPNTPQLEENILLDREPKVIEMMAKRGLLTQEEGPTL